MNTSRGDQKKTILVFPFDLMSHYLRCLVIAKKYSNYNVLFAFSETYDAFVDDSGYGTFIVKGFDPKKVMSSAAKFDFSWLTKEAIEEVFLDQVDCIKELKPDIVIGDANPALRLAAEYCGVRYVALMNGYMSRYYARTRKLPRIHPANAQLAKLPPPISNAIVRFAERLAMRSVHKPFKELRRKYRLAGKRSYLEEMEGDENLICDDEKLFPQKRLPKNYTVVGPLLYRSNNIKMPRLKLDTNRYKNICVSMGSTGSWEKLSFLSKPAFAKFNIITLGDKKRYISGPHVQALEFANFDNILPHCGFLICHGGNGTTYQAIAHGSFALCIPDHFEQEWNIQGLEALGHGVGILENIEDTLTQHLVH